jgi:hypothetical protein
MARRRKDEKSDVLMKSHLEGRLASVSCPLGRTMNCTAAKIKDEKKKKKKLCMNELVW